MISQIRAAAAPGQQHLDDATYRRLQALTAQLTGERHDQAIAEHERFLAVRKREICLPDARLDDRLGGKVILVTGGTGCVGSELISQLAGYRPARIVSVSRNRPPCGTRHEHAGYVRGDIRDAAAMHRLMREVRPDVVFHVAGQRDPGLAETEVHRTVTTNLLGTGNVLRAAAEAGAGRVVVASTGKALRPFSPDIYTASKRAMEHLVATEPVVPCAMVRFTHIVDNSIVYRKLLRAALAGEVIRLHSPDIAFYAQSAREAAQLLLLASLDEQQVRVIRDLGWPVSLLDLTLGMLTQTGSPAPVYVSGYDAGYEETPFPGLYDPLTAGDVSPLLNALEAAAVLPATCPMTDAFPVTGACGPQPASQLYELAAVCSCTEDPGRVRAALRVLSWVLLDDTLAAAPRPVLARMAALTRRAPGLSADYSRILRRIDDALRL